MILVEEFKSCLPDNIKAYVEEQKADSQQAAMLANDYLLTYQNSFITTGNPHGSVSLMTNPTAVIIVVLMLSSQLVMQQMVKNLVSLSQVQ